VGGGGGGSVGGGGGGGVSVAVGSGGAVGSAGDSSGGGRGVLVGAGGGGVLVGAGIIMEMGCSTAGVGVNVGSGVRVGWRLTSFSEPNCGKDEQARLITAVRVKGKILFNRCRSDTTIITS